MDPIVVLQYINVSIDVIINLKFEDIESKMIENNGEGKTESQKLNPRKKTYDEDEEEINVSAQLDELVVEDTP